MINQLQRAGFVPACCVLFLFNGIVTAQNTQATPPVPERDSVFAERTIVHADSIPDPWRNLGALTPIAAERVSDVGKMDRRYVQYRSLSELLYRSTAFQPLSHGGNAQHNGLSIAGGFNADLAVSVNGRTVVDPWSGSMHMAQIAPESAERYEVLTGLHAVGLASTMTLAALNVQEIIHNTPTPYSAIWYTQGGGDVLAADVELSQNVGPAMNATIGVRRAGANGRYQNTDYDVWNVRASVRYAIATRSHLQVGYQLSSLNTGLWGGLRTTFPLEQLTERTAPPVFSALHDESRRHDLTITGLHAFDEDTTTTITAQVYTSITDMLRLRDTTMFVSDTDSTRDFVFSGRHAGALIRSDHRWSWARLRLGVGTDFFDVQATPYNEQRSEFQPQAFAHLRLPLTNSVTVLSAARLLLANDRVLTAGGLGLEWTVAHGTTVTADVSTAQRAPSATEGFSLQPERHLLAEASVRGELGAVRLTAQAFYRIVSQSLVTTTDRDSLQLIRSTSTTNGTDRTAMGVVARADWESTWLELRPLVRLQSTSGAGFENHLPLVSAELSAAFVYRVGTNSVRLGIRGAFQTDYRPQQYIPTTWTYTTPVASQGMVGNGLDAYLTALLGNASIRVSYENIFASRWYTTSVSPEIIQDLRISVTWSFFD